jgi:hypothetical protein
VAAGAADAHRPSGALYGAATVCAEFLAQIIHQEPV